jgi:chromosome segregation ATPase
MQQMIEAVEAKRLTAERESERRAELARELQMRQIRELSEKYGRIERTTTELPAISSEKDRLLTLVNTLQQRVDDLFKRLEDPERRIVQIEEQRRTDSRRLSELESEIPEVRRAVDSLKPKITLIEDRAASTIS